jgi:ABC-type transporter lipoprotein component MlaA
MFALLFDLEVCKRNGFYRTFSCSSTARLIDFLNPSLVSIISVCHLISVSLQDYATTYRATRDAYLKAANELKLATGPYKAARDAYVAATATYTKSLYE